MPRDGSGVYTQPYPNVVEGTTIESAKYNGNVNDVELDLNTPRPIVAGGTGANNAKDAMIALGGEVANQQVTNYDSHAFVSGSFWSNGATGGPPMSSVSGIAHVYDATAATLEAWNYNVGVTGQSWVRQKQGGVWLPWQETTSKLADLDARYVNVAGDTMTGNLTAVTVASSGGSVWSANTATTGAFHFGTSGNKYLIYDGNNYVLAGGALFCGQISSSGAIGAGNAGAEGFIHFGNTGGRYLNYDGSNFNFGTIGEVRSNSVFNSTQGYRCRAGTDGIVSNTFNIYHDGSAQQIYIDAVRMGSIAYTSDYRAKKDVVDLQNTWDTVKALRPIKYTQADFSPPAHIKFVAEEVAKARKEAEDNPDAVPREVNTGHLLIADNIERWGFLAHELQETLTDSAATAPKDAPDAIQSPNPWTVIAALTKALQEAMARIEALEGGTAPARG
jgi:hypothetical protein